MLAVIKSRNFDHALEIANNTEFGLTGAVYSSSREKSIAPSSEFHVGNLYSIASAPERWSARIPSAASTCRAPIQSRRPGLPVLVHASAKRWRKNRVEMGLAPSMPNQNINKKAALAAAFYFIESSLAAHPALCDACGTAAAAVAAAASFRMRW